MTGVKDFLIRAAKSVRVWSAMTKTKKRPGLSHKSPRKNCTTEAMAYNVRIFIFFGIRVYIHVPTDTGITV
jgi:hypothetical protein